MANRIRNERYEIKLTEEEKALFEEKRKLSKCRNMRAILSANAFWKRKFIK